MEKITVTQISKDCWIVGQKWFAFECSWIDGKINNSRCYNALSAWGPRSTWVAVPVCLWIFMEYINRFIILDFF